MTYQIRGWNDYFENNKSRDRKSCSFVCVPNKQDGQGLMFILAEPDGLAIYGVWALLLGKASRQRVRDGWMTDDGLPNGTPWTLDALALSFRCQPSAVERALNFISSPKVGWIQQIPDSVRAVPVQCPPGVLKEGRKEGKKEGGASPAGDGQGGRKPPPDFQSGSSQDQKVISHPAVDWQSRAAGERDDQVPSPGEDFVVLDPAEHAPDPDDLVDQPARPSPERQAPVIETPVLKTRLGVLAADWPTTRLDTDQLRADWQAATEGLTRSAIAAIMDGKPCRYPSEFTPRREAWEESKRGERAAVAMNDQTARAKAEHARRVQASAQADQDSLPIAQAMLAQIDADPTVLHGQEARITARVESLRKLVAQGKSSSLMLHAIWLACPILKPDAFPGEAQQASQA